MASRNTIRYFDSESMYHVYNRGVNKQIIYNDERDYAVFLSFLKYALLPDSELKKHEIIDKDIVSIAKRFNLRRERLADRIELVAFCLMPNHFHLLLYQDDREAITALMRSIATGYAVYYNKRHKRVGPLFQGKYKACRINSDSYWIHISRYIHLNPIDLGQDYTNYPYSSYKYYMGDNTAEWVNVERGLGEFKDSTEYAEFLKDYIPHRKDLKNIADVLANSRELGL